VGVEGVAVAVLVQVGGRGRGLLCLHWFVVW
jgi:hypothetical protein